jgi:hypothetical protein
MGNVTDELVLVLTTSSVPEGEIAKARLEDEGIPVLLKGGAEGPYPTGPVLLFVAAEFEVQARLVLAGTSLEADEGRGREDVVGDGRGDAGGSA